MIQSKLMKQLIKLCAEFQPRFEEDTVAFLHVLQVAREYCSCQYAYIPSDVEARRKWAAGKFADLKAKYYFLPWHTVGSRGALPVNLWEQVCGYDFQIAVKSFTEKMVTREVILFTLLMRACRDYMRTGMSADAELFKRLEPICQAMKC